MTLRSKTNLKLRNQKLKSHKILWNIKFYHVFMGSIAFGDLILAGNLWIRIKIKKSKPFDFDWMGTGFTGS